MPDSGFAAVRLVCAVAFVATKLEAFASRGGGDFMSSHDLEDVLNIVDGREELTQKMAAGRTQHNRGVGRQGHSLPGRLHERLERAATPAA